MIPNDRAFNGKEYFEHNGKTYYRWHYFTKIGKYKLHFRILSTNSMSRQGIALFYSDDYKGKNYLNGESLKILKGFKHYVFKENEFPNNEFDLEVYSESGYLFWGNASKEFDFYRCGAFGCAFWIETISENHWRFHCNDHEYDDDFNDLIFDVECIEQS